MRPAHRIGYGIVQVGPMTVEEMIHYLEQQVRREQSRTQQAEERYAESSKEAASWHEHWRQLVAEIRAN